MTGRLFSSMGRNAEGTKSHTHFDQQAVYVGGTCQVKEEGHAFAMDCGTVGVSCISGAGQWN